MNTKDLHPGLGSGALREAQAKLITELLDVAKSFWPTDAIANSKIGSIAQRLAALSLSSPIEPPCSDCGRAEKAHPNTVCIKFTRPTPQASSEIREAATAYMNAVKEFIANRPDDEQGSQREWSAFEKQRRALYQAEKLLVVALAPSRQGAGEK